MKKFFIALTLLMVLFPIITSAATYYVSTSGLDTNAGTSSSLPWKTISKVNSVSFSPGDFILFKRGETWRETLVPPSSGSAGNPITFGAYGTGALPKIYGSTQVSTWTNENGNIWYATYSSDPVNLWFIEFGGTSTRGKKEMLKASLDAEYELWWDSANMRIYVYAATDPDTRYPSIEVGTRDFCITDTTGKGYITIDGLEMAYPNRYGIFHNYWPAPFTEAGSTPNWIVQNCKFTKCSSYMFGPNTIIQDNVYVGPQVGVGNYGAIIIRGRIAKNCSVLRNTVSGYTSRGIWFVNGADTPTANDNLVYDITSYGTDTDSFGIDFDGAGTPITGTVTAIGNTVYNCSGIGGIGIFLENCADGSLVRDNLIHNCEHAGIFFMNYNTGIYGDYPDQRGKDINAVVAYNIIYHCRYGIKLIDVSSLKIWNNAIYDGTGSNPNGLTIDDQGRYFVDNIDFRNNIIGLGMQVACSTEFARENHFSAFDNNAVENDVIVERSPYDSLSLADLRAEGVALHCFTTSPGFVNAVGHDFHLLSTSPCVNKGADVGLTQDYEGNTVPQGAAPDIGAFEFVSSTPPPQPVSGDLTGDGIVDVDDLIVVARNFGKTVYEQIADTNKDGAVDIFDIVYVASRFT